MRLAFLLFALAARAAPVAGQTSDPRWPTWPSSPIVTLTPAQCLHMLDVIDLCGGDSPTIWLNPKLEPRDVANRLLGAFEAMGYLPVEKR